MLRGPYALGSDCRLRRAELLPSLPKVPPSSGCTRSTGARTRFCWEAGNANCWEHTTSEMVQATQGPTHCYPGSQCCSGWRAPYRWDTHIATQGLSSWLTAHGVAAPHLLTRESLVTHMPGLTPGCREPARCHHGPPVSSGTCRWYMYPTPAETRATVGPSKVSPVPRGSMTGMSKGALPMGESPAYGRKPCPEGPTHRQVGSARHAVVPNPSRLRRLR